MNGNETAQPLDGDQRMGQASHAPRTDTDRSLDDGTDRTATPAGRHAWERALRESETLAPTAKLVGYALATWSTTETGADARPGSKRLQLATGKSETTVLRALQQLRTGGWLIVVNEAERERNRYLAWEYQLTIPPSALPSTHARKSRRQEASTAAVYLSPTPPLPGVGDRSQAHDSHNTSAAAREPEEFDDLSNAQAAAARQLAVRLMPSITFQEAADCIRHLAARRQPPDDFGAYTRSFTAEDVAAHAGRYRSRHATAKSRRKSAEKCPHDVAGGAWINGTGANASRICGACEAANPAARHRDPELELTLPGEPLERVVLR